MIKYSENYKMQETEVECECKNITCIAHGYTKSVYCKCGIQVWPKQGEKAQDMSDTFKRKNSDAIPTGVKHDAAKIRHSLLPHSIDDIIAVLEYGASVYGERNWELGMEWSRPWNAALRHLWAWWRGEECDKESGLPHLAHAACNLLFLLDYAKRGLGRDDRP